MNRTFALFKDTIFIQTEIVTFPMPIPYLIVISVLGAGMYLSVRANKLTLSAALVGGLVGFLVFLGGGFAGLSMLATFFVLGTLATSHQLTYKVTQGLAEQNKGKRKASQVLANGGIAALAGLLAWGFPQKAELFRLMLAASLASATSDTLSSELGNVYGRRFYNVLTFQPDQKGLDGVISLEGTLWGLAGACVIALLYALGFGWSLHLLWIVAGATVGNLSDSVLGVTLERKHRLSNDVVNLLNTLIGALAVLPFYYLA